MISQRGATGILQQEVGRPRLCGSTFFFLPFNNNNDLQSNMY